jgi:hypothetical protein
LSIARFAGLGDSHAAEDSHQSRLVLSSNAEELQQSAVSRYTSGWTD